MPSSREQEASYITYKNNIRTLYVNMTVQKLAARAGITATTNLDAGGGGSFLPRLVSVVGPLLFTIDELNTDISNAAANITTDPNDYLTLLGIIQSEYSSWNILMRRNGPIIYNIIGYTQLSLSVTDVGDNLGDGTIDDGSVLVPTGGMSFKFFGTDYGAADTIYWNSNNALIFGNHTTAPELNSSLNISSTSNLPAILLGNYDRRLISIYKLKYTSGIYNILSIYVTFSDYFILSGPTYTYQIRLIVGNQKQYVEVSVISSPPSPGYSSAITTYPSGLVDPAGNPIDPTKASPYTITNGGAFVNLCGSTFSLVSPAVGTTFVFESEVSGTNWNFINNAFVAV